MKFISQNKKDRTVRAMAGVMIIALLILQKIFAVDLSVLLFGVAFNLFQFGITGYCPIASYFTKIGWLQNN